MIEEYQMDMEKCSIIFHILNTWLFYEIRDIGNMANGMAKENVLSGLKILKVLDQYIRYNF